MSTANQQTINAYNQSVGKYMQATPQTVSGYIKTWLDKCITMVGESATVLEIGAGYGRDANYLESKGLNVKRTDVSESFVQYQIEKGHVASLLNILTDDIPSNFDMALADAVWLHFSPDEAKLAAEKVFASLNDTGIFALSIKEGQGEEFTDRKLNLPRYFCYWQEDALKNMLLGVGFSSVDIVREIDYRPGKPDWLLVIAKKIEKEL